MSLAITHFAFGGLLTTLVVLYLLPPARYERSVVLVGGLWAMIPDIHWVSPVFATELRALHETEVANAFWLHRSLDVIDTNESKTVAAIMIGAFLVSAFLADRWEYTTIEQASNPSDSVVRFVRSIRMIAALGSLVGIGVGAVFLAVLPVVRSVTGLYLGVGALLVVTGIMGLTTDGGVTRRLTHSVPPTVVRGAHFFLTIGAVTAGLALLVAPIRFGASATAIAYAGLGALLILQITLIARQWAESAV